MSKVDDVFAKAYELSVINEQHREAIDVCRQALALDPGNFRIRVFLGMLLSDYGTAEEKEQSKSHFLEAISLADNAAQICDNWFEESAIHHLAIWEWNHDSLVVASLLFLTDVLTCHSKESFTYLNRLIDELTTEKASDLKIVLSKISKFEDSSQEAE